jgi:hypothetical protein
MSDPIGQAPFNPKDPGSRETLWQWLRDRRSWLSIFLQERQVPDQLRAAIVKQFQNVDDCIGRRADKRVQLFFERTINDAHEWLDKLNVKPAEYLRPLTPLMQAPALEELLKHLSELLECVALGGQPPLRLVPGGFIYRNISIDLSGKPLEVLKEMLSARHSRISCADLLRTAWDGDGVCEETVKSAVSDAREALREALRQAKIRWRQDPIKAVDRGRNLAWKLNLP